uniref:Cytochrome P450, family 2, subfamily Y, polypeptide 3 n=1 Tax=Oryzias latipes TaxID=8090 RepID=A0A3P9J3H6_ORYLA
MDLSTSLILVVLTAVLLWLLNRRNSRNSGKQRLPPGPPALPLIGNLLQLDKKRPFRTIVELSKTYGPVMTIYMGWQRTVALVGYDAVKEALVDQADDFVGRAPLPFFYRASRGYGIGISNGERWRQLRRFTLTTLRDFGMGRKGMEQWIQEESRHLRAHIMSFKGKPFDPMFKLSCAVSNVICCFVYGERFNYDDKQFLELLKMISEILDFNGGPIGAMYNLCPWLLEHLPGHQHTVFGYIEVTRNYAKKKIQEHKDTLDPSFPRDFIDRFLIHMDQEKDNPTSEFHYENLVSTVLNLFLAGTETTSSTIRYALSVLIKHPKIQGMFSCRTPRRHPRGDTMIFPMLHSVLREDKLWSSPWSFNPQNFLDQNGNFKKNPGFVPFSAGKRACVGESLARMELFLFIVSFLQEFTFSAPNGPDSINLVPEYSGLTNQHCRYELIATPR